MSSYLTSCNPSCRDNCPSYDILTHQNRVSPPPLTSWSYSLQHVDSQLEKYVLPTLVKCHNFWLISCSVCRCPIPSSSKYVCSRQKCVPTPWVLCPVQWRNSHQQLFHFHFHAFICVITHHFILIIIITIIIIIMGSQSLLLEPVPVTSLGFSILFKDTWTCSSDLNERPDH